MRGLDKFFHVIELISKEWPLKLKGQVPVPNVESFPGGEVTEMKILFYLRAYKLLIEIFIHTATLRPCFN